ncbi:MAG TPA: DUF2282 domain-containing protein [Rhodocyclaceae bacterium]
MKNPSTLAQTAIASLLAVGIVAASGSAIGAEREKCYGISKAGQNDCGGKYTKHSCAGQAATDKDLNDFKFVPAGSCEKMGGQLKSAGEKEAEAKKKS